jgi:hypothetical protein
MEQVGEWPRGSNLRGGIKTRILEDKSLMTSFCKWRSNGSQIAKHCAVFRHRLVSTFLGSPGLSGLRHRHLSQSCPILVLNR